MDPAAHTLAPLGPQRNRVVAGGLGQVVGQGEGSGLSEVAVDAVACPELALLDRLAEHVARDAAQPAPEDAVGERCVGVDESHGYGLPVSAGSPGGVRPLVQESGRG